MSVAFVSSPRPKIKMMIRQAFHIEVVILAGKKSKPIGDSLDLILKSWRQNLKTQVFEQDGLKLRVSRILPVSLFKNARQKSKTDVYWKQVSDPTMVTQKVNRPR